MRVIGVGVLIAGVVWGQAAFQPTAKVGVPFETGSATVASDSKERLEIGARRELTLDSAELALTFPNRYENVVATANEKLLILRSTLRNPEKTSTVTLAQDALGLLLQRFPGTGKVQFVGHFHPDTLAQLRANLKGGESTKLVSVWRLPLEVTDFRIGLFSYNRSRVARYDLTSDLKPLRSIFATADGLSANKTAQVAAGATFEVDGLEFAGTSVSQPGRIEGAAVDPAKGLQVITVNVTNKLLLPARWGWQYVVAELVGTDGSVTRFYPNILDAATDRGWVGDLGAGAAVKSQFLFYPASKVTPKLLRLTMNATGRTVEVALR